MLAVGEIHLVEALIRLLLEQHPERELLQVELLENSIASCDVCHSDRYSVTANQVNGKITPRMD